jgi:hypothetical protein
MRLVLLLRDGNPVQTTPITQDEQTVKLEGPIGAGDYVRAELRGTLVLDPTNPIAGRLDMEALTNPISSPTANHQRSTNR